VCQPTAAGPSADATVDQERMILVEEPFEQLVTPSNFLPTVPVGVDAGSVLIEPVAAIRRRGVVLQSAHGPKPSLAELVVGEAIRGSWWGHPRSHEIFEGINVARKSSGVVATTLVKGKVTVVHRLLWPALAMLADILHLGALDAVHEEHTASGSHRTTTTPFPDWMPAKALESARTLRLEDAWTELPDWVRDALGGPPAG